MAVLVTCAGASWVPVTCLCAVGLVMGWTVPVPVVVPVVVPAFLAALALISCVAIPLNMPSSEASTSVPKRSAKY